MYYTDNVPTPVLNFNQTWTLKRNKYDIRSMLFNIHNIKQFNVPTAMMCVNL